MGTTCQYGSAVLIRDSVKLSRAAFAWWSSSVAHDSAYPTAPAACSGDSWLLASPEALAAHSPALVPHAPATSSPFSLMRQLPSTWQVVVGHAPSTPTPA